MPPPQAAQRRAAGSTAVATRSAGRPAAPAPKGGKLKRNAAKAPAGRVSGAAAPLHDRRRRLVSAREATLRDLGGLMLEMYKRNRFREELLLDKCEEVLAIEVEIAHIDQRLFQLAPPNAAGMRPIGRCECGAPIHPGQNFCGVCGRSFTTLTQVRMCERCGAGLRPGDGYCAGCGTQAPDVLDAIEAPVTTGASAAVIEAPADPGSTTVLSSPPPPQLDDAAPAAVAAAPGDAPAVVPPPSIVDIGPPLPPAAAPAAPAAAAAVPPAGAAKPVAPATLQVVSGGASGMSVPSLPPASDDPAIDAALAGLPDELQHPGAAQLTPVPPFGSADSSQPIAGAMPPIELTPVVVPPIDATVAPAATPVSAGVPDAPATPAPAGATPLDPRDARKLAKEKAKRMEKLKRAKAKAAKERAKQRAKDSRSNKPGDSGS